MKTTLRNLGLLLLASAMLLFADCRCGSRQHNEDTTETSETASDTVVANLNKEETPLQPVATVDPHTEVVADMATLSDYAGESGMVCLLIEQVDEGVEAFLNQMRADSASWNSWGGMIFIEAPTECDALSIGLNNVDYLPYADGRPSELWQTLVQASTRALAKPVACLMWVDAQGRVLSLASAREASSAKDILTTIKGKK